MDFKAKLTNVNWEDFHLDGAIRKVISRIIGCILCRIKLADCKPRSYANFLVLKLVDFIVFKPAGFCSEICFCIYCQL